MSTITHFDILPDIVTPGTYGDSTHVSQVTLNAKGLVTAAANVPIAGAGLITDLDSMIRARALELLGPDFSYWSDPFLTVAGKAGSDWTVYNGPVVKTFNGYGGGIQAIEAYNRAIIVDPYYLSGAFTTPGGDDVPSIIGPVADNRPFYMFCRARLHENEFYGWADGDGLFIGLADCNSSCVAGLGVQNVAAYTPFGGDVGSFDGVGLTPGAAIGGIQDFLWHDFQMARNALGRWFARLDAGAWVDFTAQVNPLMQWGTPFIAGFTQLIALPMGYVLVDHYAIAVASNLPTVSADVPALP